VRIADGSDDGLDRRSQFAHLHVRRILLWFDDYVHTVSATVGSSVEVFDQSGSAFTVQNGMGSTLFSAPFVVAGLTLLLR
jgi:hypothetical protein